MWWCERAIYLALLDILGLLYGYDGPETGEIKAEFYKRIQELGLRFENEKGSLVCRDLMGLQVKHSDSTPTERTKDFYEKRPCPALIGYAAEILEEYINCHDKNQ